eukprot:g1060.t1
MFKKVARLKGKAKAAAHGKEQPTKEPLELKLNLEPHSLILSKGETRIWRSEASDFKETEDNNLRLQQEVKKLRKEREILEDKLQSTLEEKYLVEFKNKLLVEMLAVAQLDAEKNAEANHEEQVKVEALKWELAKQHLAGPSGKRGGDDEQKA